MSSLALIAGLLAPLTIHLAEQPVVEISAADVVVADVAVIAGGTADDRVRMEALVIARLPQGRARVALSRRVLGHLVRRRTGVQIVQADGTVTIQRRKVGPSVEARACWAAAEDIAAGASLLREHVEEAPCATSLSPALRRDRSDGTLRTLGDIAAGTPLGPLAVDQLASTEAGAAITLTSRSGPVAISRPVQALQPARPGRAVFVRDADGAVFSARLDAQEVPQP